VKATVIGGAGFIGSHIVDALVDRGAEVTVLDNLCRGTHHHAGASFVHGDILHPDVVRAAVEGADVVFHLAALWLLHCDQFPDAAFNVNIGGTYNVARACKEAGVGRVVYSSSASVYGNARDVPINEDHPLDNCSFYGATKIAGEQIMRAVLPNNSVSLRYMNVYGERQDDKGAYVAVLMRWLRQLDAGEPIEIHGDGSQVYDFVHVSDVARANLAAALTSEAVGEYNVGTGVGTSLKALAHKLTDNVIYRSGPTHYVSRRIGCPRKASIFLDFQSDVDVDEGLRRLRAWYR
jgi:UDP-glucose 4-epimerase